MITIPKNTILKSKGLGDTIGDIIESFNLDLSENYGAIRTTRTKKVTVSDGVLDKPVGFCVFGGNYYFVCNDYVYKGGSCPSDSFSYVLNNTDISNAGADIKVFNNAIYVVVGGAIYKSTDGTNFSSAIGSGITSASPHLLETFADRLYITDNYTKVRSISTSDVLTTDGQDYSINLNLGSGVSYGWSITSLKKAGNLIWIGLSNSITGKGLIYSWDGVAQIPNEKFELSSSVIAGTVLNNIFYIVDRQGILKKYSGSSFTEVAKFTKENPNFLNTTFIHPNGMQATDTGMIQILISNLYSGDLGYEDKIASGVWEYDPNIGLYHKYSCSVSSTSGTTLNDYGQIRIANVGALCVNKPLIPDTTKNGTLLFGANYYTNDSTTQYGLFCDDTIDTTQKYAYFTTSFILSDTEDTWQKIYTTYKKLLNSTDKIILKYRTEDETPTTATITFTDIDRFTTITDLSGYGVGDEIQVIQGVGSGKSAHIKSISGGTYILDDNFPTAVIGLTSKANISHWIKLGEATYDEMKQIKPFTMTKKNISPFLQIKVCMQFTGKDELYKLKIINDKHIKE